MKTILYFNNENEIREFAEKKGIEYINDRIDRANEGQDYYAPFREIEGCELLYVMIERDLYLCIRWKGVTMRANIRYHYEEKTYAFCLCDETDWQGISEYRNSVSRGNIPQRVGKPTAKKLDDWRTYLLDLRRREEENRDRAFARMVAKITEVRNNFPEAKSVKWTERGYWCFEKVSNGLKYSISICSDGEIFEKLDFVSYEQCYNIGTAEKTARMMKNGLEEVKPISKDCQSPYQLLEETYEAYISQFMGGRPF